MVRRALTPPDGSLMAVRANQHPEEAMMAAFTLADIPDLTGRTVIVTGGSSGSGQATAKALAAFGAPELTARSAAARDRDLARRLWAVSEQLTGARSPLQPVPRRS